MFSLDMVGKSSETGAVTMIEIVSILIQKFRDFGMSDTDIIDSLVVGFDAAVVDFKKGNPEHDTSEIMKMLSDAIDNFLADVKKAKEEMP